MRLVLTQQEYEVLLTKEGKKMAKNVRVRIKPIKCRCGMSMYYRCLKCPECNIKL